MEKQYRIGRSSASRFFYPTRNNESQSGDNYWIYFNEIRLDYLTDKSEEYILTILKIMNRVDEEIHRTEPKI